MSSDLLKELYENHYKAYESLANIVLSLNDSLTAYYFARDNKTSRLEDYMQVIFNLIIH